MEHIQRYEQFILSEADETFDFEKYLNHEVAVFKRHIDSMRCHKQLKILDANGQSSLLALGLSLQGHDFYSTNKIDVDLPESLQLSMRQPIKHFQWHQETTFDVVILSHNAISENLTEDDLCLTLVQMLNVLRENGSLLMTTRFYDRLLRLQPNRDQSQQIMIDGKQCIQLSVWDWLCKSNCTYLQSHYIIQQIAGDCKSYHSSSHHRAWRRAEINMMLSQVGFMGIQYHSVSNDQVLIRAIKR